MTTAELAHRGIHRSGSILSSLILLVRPGILALVCLAGFTGMVMAAKGVPGRDVSSCVLLSLLLSAAGSVMINSVLDYRLDLKMSRLRARVEAMNVIGRSRVMFIACSMMAASLLISSVYINSLVSLLILAAVIFYIGPYTLWLKRNSPYGAVPGAVPGALPVLIGYAAVDGAVRPEAMLLFLVVFLWQPPHFWIYALKYGNDYRNSGVPAMPVALGEERAKGYIIFFAFALLPVSVALGFFAHFSTWYNVSAVLLASIFIASCLFHVKKRSSFSLAFKVSVWYLLFLLLAVIIDVCMRAAPRVTG